MTGPFLTTAQAAEYLATTEGALRVLLTEKKGPRYYKRGRRNVFLPADLDEWMTANVVEVTPEHVA